MLDCNDGRKTTHTHTRRRPLRCVDRRGFFLSDLARFERGVKSEVHIFWLLHRLHVFLAAAAAAPRRRVIIRYEATYKG